MLLQAALKFLKPGLLDCGQGWPVFDRFSSLLEFTVQGTNRLIANAARHNMAEIIQMRAHVKGQAVHGDPTTCFDPHGTYFAG